MTLGGVPHLAGGRWHRVALGLALGPPLLLASVRAWLEWQDGRHAPTPAFALSPLPVSDSAVALLLPGVLAALALLLVAAGLRWWWRRGGARAVQRLLLVLWALLWLCGTGAVLVAHANTARRAALPAQEATVLGLRPRPPTLREVGGSEVILALAGRAQPQRVRINDERAALWPVGQRLQLQLAQGRFYGLYLTDWDRLEPAPASQ